MHTFIAKCISCCLTSSPIFNYFNTFVFSTAPHCTAPHYTRAPAPTTPPFSDDGSSSGSESDDEGSDGSDESEDEEDGAQTWGGPSGIDNSKAVTNEIEDLTEQVELGRVGWGIVRRV